MSAAWRDPGCFIDPMHGRTNTVSIVPVVRHGRVRRGGISRPSARVAMFAGGPRGRRSPSGSAAPELIPSRAMELRTVDSDRTPIWQRLLGREDASAWLKESVTELLRPEYGSAGVVHGAWCHVIDRRGPLMLSALLHKPEGGGPLEVRSMHPYTESGYLWPMHLKVIERSSDGGTAVVMGSTGPAAMGLFDTMHFRRSYEDATEYRFQVSGIALSLRREELPELYAPDFCGYGNLRLLSGDREQPADVIEFHSVVQATQRVELWGVPLTRYLLTIAKLGDRNLTFDVYGNDDVVGRYAVGDRVGGHVWVFGFAT